MGEHDEQPKQESHAGETDLQRDSDEIIDKKDEENPIDEFHRFLLDREQRSPEPTDLITVAEIPLDSEEYQRLIAAGVTPEEFENKEIPRKKLQDAGYVFVNRMFLKHKGQDMQKPLINDSVDGIDYGSKTLLTQEELERLKKAQGNPEITDDIRDEMRTDMASFMYTTYMGRPRQFDTLPNVFNSVLKQMDEDEKEQFKKFFADWSARTQVDESKLGAYDKQLDRVKKIAAFIQTYCKDIFPWQESIQAQNFPVVRDLHLETYASRRDALLALPSPFLDSGFEFPEASFDMGINLMRGEELDHRRLNLMVWHLAGQGISEVGNSSGRATDQQYMSIDDYYDLFFRDTTPDERQVRRGQEHALQQLIQGKTPEDFRQQLRGRFNEVMSQFQIDQVAQQLRDIS